MKRTIRIAVAAVAAVAGLTAAGVAAVNASTSDDNDIEIDTPITGTDLQKASDAALAATGQGRVTGTEVGDEESYYEIEVTLDNGTEVDVQLDKDFKVVSSEADTADADHDETD